MYEVDDLKDIIINFIDYLFDTTEVKYLVTGDLYNTRVDVNIHFNTEIEPKINRLLHKYIELRKLDYRGIFEDFKLYKKSDRYYVLTILTNQSLDLEKHFSNLLDSTGITNTSNMIYVPYQENNYHNEIIKRIILNHNIYKNEYFNRIINLVNINKDVDDLCLIEDLENESMYFNINTTSNTNVGSENIDVSVSGGDIIIFNNIQTQQELTLAELLWSNIELENMLFICVLDLNIDVPTPNQKSHPESYIFNKELIFNDVIFDYNTIDYLHLPIIKEEQLIPTSEKETFELLSQ